MPQRLIETHEVYEMAVALVKLKEGPRTVAMEEAKQRVLKDQEMPLLNAIMVACQDIEIGRTPCLDAV